MVPLQGGDEVFEILPASNLGIDRPMVYYVIAMRTSRPRPQKGGGIAVADPQLLEIRDDIGGLEKGEILVQLQTVEGLGHDHPFPLFPVRCRRRGADYPYSPFATEIMPQSQNFRGGLYFFEIKGISRFPERLIGQFRGHCLLFHAKQVVHINQKNPGRCSCQEYLERPEQDLIYLRHGRRIQIISLRQQFFMMQGDKKLGAVGRTGNNGFFLSNGVLENPFVRFDTNVIPAPESLDCSQKRRRAVEQCIFLKIRGGWPACLRVPCL